MEPRAHHKRCALIAVVVDAPVKNAGAEIGEKVTSDHSHNGGECFGRGMNSCEAWEPGRVFP